MYCIYNLFPTEEEEILFTNFQKSEKFVHKTLIGLDEKSYRLETHITDLLQTVTQNFGYTIGAKIARMHIGGLIHGDLTTSNVILRNNDPSLPVFVDFGLSTQGKVCFVEFDFDIMRWLGNGRRKGSRSLCA